LQRNPLRHGVNERLDPGMKDRLELDVAIIGAGTSGLYTGWRLLTGEHKGRKKKSAPPRVQIFELSNRIAGRLHSVYLPGMGDVAGELGGMRYMDQQQIVSTLIEKLFKKELKSVDFPMGDPAKHFFYGRTQRCRANAWTEAQKKKQTFKTNYFLREDLVGYDSDQLFNKVIYDVLVADPWFRKSKYAKLVTNPSKYNYTFQLTSRDWDEVKPRLTYNFPGSPYHGKKVNDLGFWNLLKDQTGEEAYEFLSVAGGYYSNTINWNAAEAFPYMVGDFSNTGTSYKTIDGGYDLLAYAVANAYLGQPEAKIWIENQLITFNKQPADSQFRYSIEMYNVRSRRTWTVYANAIVLAMPRRSLELLDQNNFFFNPEKRQTLQQNISSVIMEPSFKLLVAFENAWWKKDFGTNHGESITDLPMRQCYYFDVNKKNGHALFLASYNDMRTVPFWSPLEKRHGHGQFQPRATRGASQEELDALIDVQATQVMVDEAMKEVRELHGREDIPQPYVSWFKNWAEDPFGGGYHGWKAGVSVKHVMPYMRQPLPGEAVHICGEAYSDQQGWVEGAFCEAEKMLEDHFGLAWPKWLARDYYLGW
jgi:monoamine oxidase